MATIGKTFSDPDKWESGWFSRLTPEQKLLYTYIWERCDHAGVIEYVPAVWSAHIGHQVDDEALESLIKVVNVDRERIMRLSGKLWMTEYIRFNQQADKSKPLAKGKPFHQHVYNRIIDHGIIQEVQKRDPILLKDFIPVNDGIPNTSNDKPIINQSLPNVAGKGKSKEGGQEQSIPDYSSNGAKKKYDPSKFAASFKK